MRVYNFSDLLLYAKERLSPSTYNLFMQNDPRHHAPMWHELGLLGHLNCVAESAELLLTMTNVDVRLAALYHDIAKLDQFDAALKLHWAGEDPGAAYKGHEALSANIAQEHELDDSNCLAIAFHQFAYLDMPYPVRVELTSRRELLYKWMTLCTADAMGKGWTENQKLQRPQIAERFRDLACEAGLPSNDGIVNACCFWVSERSSPVSYFSSVNLAVS